MSFAQRRAELRVLARELQRDVALEGDRQVTPCWPMPAESGYGPGVWLEAVRPDGTRYEVSRRLSDR